MAYRNKTYVAFDGDNDIHYYRLMLAWKANDHLTFQFYNAHDLNYARDTSTEEQIKRQLRIRMNNSKLFLLLVGKSTKNLYKFVRWEIETALKLDLPIIVVNLNNKKEFDSELCPPILRGQLSIHISYKQKIIEYAIDNWGESHRRYRSLQESGAFRYKNQLYEDLGIY